MGGGTQGCAQGSSGVQTPRGPQGHQLWVPWGESAHSHFLEHIDVPGGCFPWCVPPSPLRGPTGPSQCPPALLGSGGEMGCCLFPQPGWLWVPVSEAYPAPEEQPGFSSG